MCQVWKESRAIEMSAVCHCHAYCFHCCLLAACLSRVRGLYALFFINVLIQQVLSASGGLQ